jgi:hypothetical protein
MLCRYPDPRISQIFRIDQREPLAPSALSQSQELPVRGETLAAYVNRYCQALVAPSHR